MTSSSDLMDLLKASLAPPSRPSPGYLVGELQDPTGTRRADALYVPLGHATRGTIHGYEFKVSRSDLIVELADPMKADPWMRYCTTWTLFVSDPRLITGLTSPRSGASSPRRYPRNAVPCRSSDDEGPRAGTRRTRPPDSGHAGSARRYEG